MLDIWRANSSELPIKENMTRALNLIESMLSGDENKALTVIEPQDTEPAERLAAALRIIYNIETDPKSLFYAHTFITKSLINERWIDPVLKDLAELLSTQWLKKITEIPIRTVSQVEQTCKSNETGKKKIGQILLAAYQAVSISLPLETLQQFHKWAESPLK